MSDQPLGVEGVVELTLDEGRALLDDAARSRLGMSGEDFLAAWDAGTLREPCCGPAQEVAMLIPFAR